MADKHDAQASAHLREAILSHLQCCPLAADTTQGIASFWLAPGYENALELIDEVVEAMLAGGELAARPLPDGRILYVRGSKLSSVHCRRS